MQHLGVAVDNATCRVYAVAVRSLASHNCSVGRVERKAVAMQQTPQTQPVGPQQPPQGQPSAKWSDQALDIAFREYQLLMEGTDKITDRRQTVNTLFVSINALFLTGVGYLLLQFFHDKSDSGWFIGGFIIIAFIMTFINNTWLKLSESNRRLVDLRIRYMQRLEAHMRIGGIFPPVETPLKGDEAEADLNLTVVDREQTTNVRENGQIESRRVSYKALVDRGTYTIEDVLYSPTAQKVAFGFSRAEQRIGRMFAWSYWLAVALALFAFVVTNWSQVLQLLRQLGLPV